VLEVRRAWIRGVTRVEDRLGCGNGVVLDVWVALQLGLC